MIKYRDRYGIPGEEIWKIRRLYDTKRLQVGFGNFDNFVKFCSQNGYSSEKEMYRHNENEPHGSDNTYFDEKKEEETGNWICSDCKRTECSPSGIGCGVYRKRFVENWNKHIHYSDPRRNNPKPGAREFFQYEHPDLVREGIVFESSSGL